MKTRTFTTQYLTASGLLMIFGDEYFVIVRVSDGRCGRFRYDQWDLPDRRER